MAYEADSTGQQIKAVLFDTFGTVVDWRSGVARDIADFAERHRLTDLDAWAFTDAWRAKYEPSMEPIRKGIREFVPLDQLHRENLISTLTEFGLDPSAYGDELDDLAAAWERLDPWDDSVAGLTELGRHVIIGPLSNANLALLLRMALRADLPWTVIMGSDIDPRLQAEPAGLSQRRTPVATRPRGSDAGRCPQRRSGRCSASRARHRVHPAPDRVRTGPDERPGRRG